MPRDWFPGEGEVRENPSPADLIEEGLRKQHTDETVWHCEACGYKPNVGHNPCQNCGRDFIGFAGTRPTHYDREPRAGLRQDVYEE